MSNSQEISVSKRLRKVWTLTVLLCPLLLFIVLYDSVHLRYLLFILSLPLFFYFFILKKVFRERLILLEDEIIVINRNYTSKFKLVKIKEIELNIMHSPGGVWLRVDYFEDQKEDFVNFDFMQSALIDFAKWAKLKSEGRIQVKSNVDIDKEHSFWICNYGVLAPFWLVTIVITILKFLY